jgi:hypothetical protein
MNALLQFCGYTAYQAQCLAPVLWFLVAAGTFAAVVELDSLNAFDEVYDALFPLIEKMMK